MRKSIIIIAALAALVSCQSLKEEWQPVFTFGPNVPEAFIPVSPDQLTAYGFKGHFTSIADLKGMYKNAPLLVYGNIWIAGQVISDDRSGNIYRELYIQDDSGGIDLKLGKSSLYSEYKLGQWIYVHCDGLTLGSYEGMPQLGYAADETSTNEYESSYIDLQSIIDRHVFKGAYDTPLEPEIVTEADIKKAVAKGFKGEIWGKYVTIEDLTYMQQIFALLYPNPNLPHKSGNPENRVFLSYPNVASEVVPGKDYTWGITTWAMSKAQFVGYLEAGNFDEAQVGSGATRYGTIEGSPADYLPAGKVRDSFGSDMDLPYKDIMIKYATANYVSHYFSLPGGTTVQVRTSGYSRFSDTPLDENLRSGAAKATITGILTTYNGAAQFTLLNVDGVEVE